MSSRAVFLSAICLILLFVNVPLKGTIQIDACELQGTVFRSSLMIWQMNFSLSNMTFSPLPAWESWVYPPLCRSNSFLKAVCVVFLNSSVFSILGSHVFNLSIIAFIILECNLFIIWECNLCLSLFLDNSLCIRIYHSIAQET